MLLSDEIDSELQQLSIISSGSAALAVQTLLRLYDLPPLRVLVDVNINPAIADRLENLGCLVFPHALDERLLNEADVLRLTHNPKGRDITSRDVVDPDYRKYYDWLSYEILNLRPRYVFVPVGTGDLFYNLARVAQQALVDTRPGEGRLSATKDEIRGITLFGATTKDPGSTMDKLYAPYRPGLDDVVSYVERFKASGFFGAESGLAYITDERISDALQIAATYDLHTEASGIAGLALLLEKERDLPRNARIVVVNTGLMNLPGITRQRTPTVRPERAERSSNDVRKPSAQRWRGRAR